MVKQIPTKAEFDKELADAGGKVRCAPVVALTVVLVVCVCRGPVTVVDLPVGGWAVDQD